MADMYGDSSPFDNYQTRPPQTGITPQEEAKDLGININRQARVTHILDSPTVRKRFKRVNEWWEQCRKSSARMRYEMIRDNEYYDGEQWTAKDKLILEERGQAPLVFNRIKPTADWMIGTEKRTRVDYRIMPRGAEDAQLAEIKTKLLKYVSDVNKAGYARSDAAADAFKSGLGWLEMGIRSDPTEEPLFVRYEDWRNVWWDLLSRERDLSDARYVARSKWVDVDLAIGMFPDRAWCILAAMNEDSGFLEKDEEEVLDFEILRESEGGQILPDFYHTIESASRRNRVRLVEMWYRLPTAVKVMRGRELGTLAGARYRDDEPSHQFLVEEGIASLYDAIKLQVRVMMFCGNYVLYDGESPYNHDRYPFVPVWCYRKKKNGEPYGILRNLRDPQDDLNKRRSKALHILSTKQLMADENASDDWTEVRQELNRADGIVKFKANTQHELINDNQLAAQHLDLMRDDAEYIESTGGVTDENMGRETNAASGRAILARTEQGHVVTTEPFDNLRFAIQNAGEIQLSLIEQFYTEPKVIRIVGDNGKIDFLQMNQRGEAGVENDITGTKADFVVDSMNWSASIRQAMFESMLNLMGQMPPEVALQLLDLVVDLSDLPGKDEMVKRIRAMSGQEDPNEDPDDPEVRARNLAREEQEAKRQMLEDTMAGLEVEGRRAVADRDRATAETARTKARIEKAKALHSFEMAERQTEAELTERKAKGNKQMVPAKTKAKK